MYNRIANEIFEELDWWSEFIIIFKFVTMQIDVFRTLNMVVINAFLILFLERFANNHNQSNEALFLSFTNTKTL